MNRRGFTFIELLVVITLLGILINIAIPAVTALRKRADAARVVTDFNTIRGAAFDRYADTGTYPASAGWGQVPRAMVPSLPSGFDFRHGTVTYRWQALTLRGLFGRRDPTSLLIVQVQSPDPEMITAILRAFAGDLAFGGAGTATFIVAID